MGRFSQQNKALKASNAPTARKSTCHLPVRTELAGKKDAKARNPGTLLHSGQPLSKPLMLGVTKEQKPEVAEKAIPEKTVKTLRRRYR